MAGNLVKWWKHKILGGYKQFSVPECTTDSEELMYHQVRASSSCSAPPDLLLVSDRENNIPLRSPVVNIIAAAASTTAPTTTTTSPSSGINACHITSATNNNQQKHNQKLQYHQQQQQLSLSYNNGTKDGIVTGTGIGGKHQKQSVSSNGSKQHGQLQATMQDIQPTSTVSHDIMEGQLEIQQTNSHSSSKQHAYTNQQQQQQQQHHQRPEEHIRLEEFTCDVSVEGGKSSQPLQFSFTFYDLDGHHGKITKDDIVGIVYTIYESIGKSVVVPHSGSKTINVRLTVSPEGKSKSTKNKKALNHSLSAHQKATALASNTQAAARRLHRYRPRKLIKSDDEDDDSNSDKERIENLSHVLAHRTSMKSQKLNKLKAEQNCCTQQQTLNQHTTAVTTDLPKSPLDTIYDNLKASSPPEACRECLSAVDETQNTSISPLVSAATTATPLQFSAASKTTNNTNEAYMKHVASTRIKMLRKSRKQKHQDCLETRQRSLSLGNETCWKNRHLQTKQPNQQQLLWQAEHQLNHSVAGGDIVDGVQLRNPLKNGKSMVAAQKRNSAECWKSALNRNDLIGIIRESMEKNRLCFQLNGKPQANVSPIRQQTSNFQQQSQSHNQQKIANSSSSNNNNNNKHSQQQHQVTSVTCAQRQRSNTISKIPTLIANHSNAAHHSVSPQHHQRSSSCANTTSNCNNNSQQHDTNLHEHHNNTNSSVSSNNIYHHHLQPHIPIYHQQMAINPAVIAAQNALLTGNTSGKVVGSLARHHGKMNLCGYDSFLHATICGGGLSHSPPPPPSAQPQATATNQSAFNTQITSPSASNISGLHHQHQQQHQQIATVQPIMSNNTHHSSKHLSLAVTPTQIKTSKILRSGSYTNQTNNDTQQNHHSNLNIKQNSPQYHGYQRLPSSSKHNLSALHLLSPNAEKRSLGKLDKWRRDQAKNYDQLLYDKLSEKLQQTNLVASNSNQQQPLESNQRRKQRLMRQRRANALVQETNNVSLAATVSTNTICLRENTNNDYAAMIPIVGDPVECENLLGQTSDEETHSQHETMHLKAKEDVTNCKQQPQQHRHVAEGTLVDLDDVNEATPAAQNAQLSKLNVDALLSVETDTQVHNLHNLVDDLEIDEDLEEDLDDELEELPDVEGSGRNSANSNNSSNAANATAATLVNTTGKNSSSLIHRYVHEHIHHHYHHFEEKEE